MFDRPPGPFSSFEPALLREPSSNAGTLLNLKAQRPLPQKILPLVVIGCLEHNVPSRNRRRWRRWTILTVAFFDLHSHFFEALTFVDHSHHVTRDADADVSAEAHSIDYRFFRRRVVLEIARSMLVCPCSPQPQ